ncbi:AMP deaminase [Sarracenia purpurea var. burkii]
MDSSSSPSSHAVSSMHLALAALFGASVMAISAFYLHKRSVDQVLDRLIKLRRQYPSSSPADADIDAGDRLFISEDDGGEALDGGGGYFGTDGGIEIDRDKRRHGSARLLDDNGLSCYRVSSSMPNVGLSNEWLDDDVNGHQPMRFGIRASLNSLDKLNLIPFGLPPLDTARKDEKDHSVNNSSSNILVGPGGRLMTPRSSCSYAFGSTGDSDEEGTEHMAGQDIVFTYDNINSSAECTNLIDNNSSIQNLSAPPFEADSRSCILDQKCRAIANEAKEEEEVRKMLHECLDLRERYVYREKVAPWRKPTVDESSVSGTNIDPFCFVPVEATAHRFRMEDGVVRVYATENGKLHEAIHDTIGRIIHLCRP